MSLLCGGTNPLGLSTADCWLANRPELGALSWTQQTAAGPFQSQLANAALVTLYDNSSTLLLCGGAVGSTAISTCWVSSNLAVSWSAGITASWGARSGLAMTSDLDGWAYVYGGVNSAGVYYYDLWLSTDKASSWSLVTQQVGQMITIQGGCLALRYTVTYVNGVPSTNKALVYYTGVQSGGGYLQGDVVQTLSVSGVSIYVPPPAPLVFTLDQVRSQCQFTINVAGTLTGYGASGPSPNPLFSISAVASLVSAQLGIAASAVQVCVHVTYAYLSNQRGEVYVLLSGNSTVNVTSIAAIGNTTVTSSPSVIVVTPSAPSSSSGAPIPSSSSSVSAALSSSTGVSLGASSVTSSAASPLTSSSSTGRSSGGSVVGDPQFVGLLGQSYQVHGIDGAVYNLISDQAGALLINARFTFLTAGRCPTRVNATNCWTHRGSYLTEVGVVAPSGERLYIGSGAADDGFSMVSVDGVELAVGSTYTTATTTKSAADGTGLTVTRPTAWTVEFAVGNFALTVENSDRFVNLVAVRVVEWDKLSSHGLLGQTWRAPSTRGIDVAVVEGSVDDYAEADNELMGGGFVYKA